MELNHRAPRGTAASRELSQHNAIVDDFPSTDTPQQSKVRVTVDEQNKTHSFGEMGVDGDEVDQDHNKERLESGELALVSPQGHSKSWDKIRKGFNLTNLDMSKSSMLSLPPTRIGSVDEVSRVGSPKGNGSGANTPKIQVRHTPTNLTYALTQTPHTISHTLSHTLSHPFSRHHLPSPSYYPEPSIHPHHGRHHPRATPKTPLSSVRNSHVLL